ncbi:MAG: DUF411 domain-containing protein [Gemmatimonadaceae bacterium]|nr:DUF411 domain-containing protein [Gemmatimonadaceae bacterium]MCC6431933.1 DUF411 domain-containing protein [Gemmatimonadaceae bacterium]
MSTDRPSSRRLFLAQLATSALATSAVLANRAQAAGLQPPVPSKSAAKSAPIRDIVVYKDPHCGCCSEWVKHMKAAGFVVTSRDTADMTTVKRSMGVPEALESCHTGRIGRYTIEGHVPADVIAKLLAEQPAGRGLAVPGMPVGSPGMEMGGRKDKYDVLLFDAAGKTRVYASR